MMKINYLEVYESILKEAKEPQFGLSIAEHGGLKSFLLFDQDLHVYTAAGVERYGEYEEVAFIAGTQNKVRQLIKIITSFVYPRKLIPNREHVDIFELQAFISLYGTSGVETELLPTSLQKNFGKSSSDSAQHKNYYTNLAYSGKIMNLDSMIKIGEMYLKRAKTSHEKLLDKTIGV